MLSDIYLKKGEDRRLAQGHPWVFSNEIDTQRSPLKSFSPGQEIMVKNHQNQLLGVGYINPQSLICIRLTSRDDSCITQDTVATRLKKALEWREAFFDKPFYRWVYAESDALPGLIIDRFGQYCVVQVNTAGMEAKKDMIVSAIRQVLPDTAGIVFKNTSSIRALENLPTYTEIANGDVPDTLTIHENNATFHASALTGQKTGWFYDHRANRLRLKEYVKDRRVLDLFSYLGAWGIQAALYGAKEVLCLDSSKTALDFVRKNAELNGLTNIDVLCEDAFKGLKHLQQQAQTFDVIILDPPAFIKKNKDRKEGLLAYQRLNSLAMKLLTPGGFLFSCSCSMHLSADDLVQVLHKASNDANCTFQIIERGHQAQDHPVHPAIPETDYLKMVVGRVAD